MAHSRLCSIPDCGKPHVAGGYCNKHYKRWRAHGDHSVMLIRQTEPGKIEEYIRTVVIPYDGDDCLSWPFASTGPGIATIAYKGKHHNAARVICTLTKGSPPTPEHEAAHSCGKGHEGCINPRHLLWKTHKQNEADKAIHGTRVRGERHGRSRLSEADVLEIRRLDAAMSRREIAARYGLSSSHVVDIINGKKWGWLTNAGQSSPASGNPPVPRET